MDGSSIQCSALTKAAQVLAESGVNVTARPLEAKQIKAAAGAAAVKDRVKACVRAKKNAADGSTVDCKLREAKGTARGETSDASSDAEIADEGCAAHIKERLEARYHLAKDGDAAIARTKPVVPEGKEFCRRKDEANTIERTKQQCVWVYGALADRGRSRARRASVFRGR